MSGTGAKRNNEGVVWALLKFTKNWKRSKKGHLRLQPLFSGHKAVASELAM